MIPLAQNFMWFGVVEDVNDPSQLGRVRVRILGIHTEDKSLIPTESLPWAKCMMPLTSASISGVGWAPVGLVPGALVSGIFLDGADMQQPIVMFSNGGNRSTNKSSAYGFNDPDGLYPTAGTTSDINPLAGGNVAASPQMQQKTQNRVQNVGIDNDPTVTPPTTDPNFYKSAPWMPTAMSQIGINEESNASTIKNYLLVGGGIAASESVAWCAAFANWCLLKAGIKGTGSALARSFLNWGVSTGRDNIPYGAIAVMTGTRGPSSGHVCFVTKDLGTKIEVIGGNQTTDNSGGTIVKYDTGGRVTKITFPKTVLLDTRMPTNLNTVTTTVPTY